MPVFFGAGAHGEFVAEIADGGQAHAGNAQMLAQSGDIFHVEFVERDDAVDGLRSGGVADGVDELLQSASSSGMKNISSMDSRGQSRVAQFFDGEQEDAAADRLARAQKFLPLFVGADTEDGERTALWHR